jgi:type I restriction enzyme S subunit
MLKEYLSKRYPKDSPQQVAVRSYVLEAWDRFRSAGLGDKNMEAEMCSGNEARYHQRMSELLLADQMLQAGLKPSSTTAGPDFLLETNERRTWIEVVCPEPNGIPSEYLQRKDGECLQVPHEAILLRWTAALQEKWKKLNKYIEKDLVLPEDSYVIAVNGRMLSDFGGMDFVGISQFPYAVEAAFAVGPLAMQIDRKTLELIKTEHQHRPLIPKPKGKPVEASMFLSEEYSRVSAIWATSIDETIAIGNPYRSEVVHNPRASTPLQINLPAFYEHRAENADDGFMVLSREPGLLKR